MTTVFLASYDPHDSTSQRTKKLSLIRAHAARISHVARRQAKVSRSPRAVLDQYENATYIGVEDEDGDHKLHYSESSKQIPAKSIPAFIGNTRNDPFQCYPIILQHHEHILVDYSINILPYRFYGITKSGVLNLAVNFFRDVVFPLTLQEPVSFRCFVLAISAIHRADIAKVSFTQEMEHQKLLSLRMLRAHFLQQPEDCSDAAISMCLFSAVLEMAAGYEEHRACFIHLQQVARLISLRGGPDALQHNPRLVTVVNVYHYVAHDVYDGDVPIIFDSHLHMNTGFHLSSIEPTRYETQVLCETFIQFIRDVTTLSNMQETLAFSRIATLLRSVLKSSIANFLFTWEWSSFSDWESTRTSFVWTRNQQMYGMCLLLHLNAAMWDFQADITKFEMFLTELSCRLAPLTSNRNYSVEAASHAVLLPPSNPVLAHSHFDRLWTVGKLLSIAKRLDNDSWQRLRTILLSNLTFQNRPLDTTWEENFRRVALSIPSRSWLLLGKPSEKPPSN